MTAIAICNPKGGTGKTTLSLNLAVLLSQCGATVQTFDVDPQASLYDCIKKRPKNLTAIPCSKCDLKESVARLRQPNVFNKVIILDCPSGLDAASLSQLAPYLDAIIIPVNASHLDYNAMTHFCFNLAQLDSNSLNKINMAMVINKTRKHIKLHQEVISWFHQLSVETITEIRDTVNYSMSTHYGIGIAELPISKVSKDISSWKPILTWLNKQCGSAWQLT